MQCRAIPYEGNEPFIFFSYSHKDADRVYPLLEQMVRDGFRVWYDDGNHAGDDWLENIGQHLNRCTVCLAMLSENAEQSHNCKKEVSFAVQCNKKLLAIMLEKFAMTMGMRLQLSTIHYLVKTEYPSNTALLNKLYESECLRECRTVPGSIRMRSIVTEDQPLEQQPQKSKAVDAFLGTEIKRENVEAPEAPISDTVPTKEEAPQPKKHAKLKVRQVQKVAYKVAEKAAPKDAEDAVSVEPVEKPQPCPQNEPVADVQEPRIVEIAEPKAEEPSEAEAKTVYAGRSSGAQQGPDSVTISAGKNEDAVLVRLNTREVYSIASALTRIGRSPKRCDFEIAGNTSVSNHHADIIYYNDSYYIKDAGSSNGTFIGETKLGADQRAELTNMSVFRVSDEPIMLIFGEAVAVFQKMKKVAFLINKDTQCAQPIGADGIHLDRSHKWADGTCGDAKVSREHAVIRYVNNEFVLEDLGSRNGTYLENGKITPKEPIVLQDKAQIRISDSALEFGLISI